MRPADKSYLQKAEAELGISLPADFWAATDFFDGSGFAVLPLHAMLIHFQT